jgi:predicted aldo/keto reductase-like oxidoreductase
LEQALIDTFGKEWVDTWQLGLPSPEVVPNNISIRTILWLRNLALAYDLTDYGKMRYNLLGNGGHWFPGQQAKNVQALDFSLCLQHSPHREIIPQLLQETDQLLGGESIKRLSQST